MAHPLLYQNDSPLHHDKNVCFTKFTLLCIVLEHSLCNIFTCLFFLSMCGALPAPVSVHHIHAESPAGPNGTGVTDGCELACGCWESNRGSLKEQSVI